MSELAAIYILIGVLVWSLIYYQEVKNKTKNHNPIFSGPVVIALWPLIVFMAVMR